MQIYFAGSKNFCYLAKYFPPTMLGFLTVNNDIAGKNIEIKFCLILLFLILLFFSDSFCLAKGYYQIYMYPPTSTHSQPTLTQSQATLTHNWTTMTHTHPHQPTLIHSQPTPSPLLTHTNPIPSHTDPHLPTPIHSQHTPTQFQQMRFRKCPKYCCQGFMQNIKPYN